MRVGTQVSSAQFDEIADRWGRYTAQYARLFQRAVATAEDSGVVGHLAEQLHLAARVAGRYGNHVLDGRGNYTRVMEWI